MTIFEKFLLWVICALVILGGAATGWWLEHRFDYASPDIPPQEVAVVDSNLDVLPMDDIRVTIVGVVTNITVREAHRRWDEITGRIGDRLGTNGVRTIIVEIR